MEGIFCHGSGVGDDVTFYECAVDFIATSGQPVHMEQVVVARWKDGKIVHERFYYDTGVKVWEIPTCDTSRGTEIRLLIG